MKRLILLAVSCCLIPRIGSAAVYTVSGSANIYSTAGTNPAASGSPPCVISIPAGQGNEFEFAASSLFSISGAPAAYSPNGDGNDSRLNGSGGISGYFGPDLALVGYFLGATGADGTAPPTLDFSAAGLGASFATLSPQLGQVFLIGDGLSDGALIRTIVAPEGATRLYLGIPDCFSESSDTACYDPHERGHWRVKITCLPEPGHGTLLGLGLALHLAFRGRAQGSSRAIKIPACARRSGFGGSAPRALCSSRSREGNPRRPKPGGTLSFPC